MKQPLAVTGITVQARAADFAAGAHWYTALLRR
jgi:hypothetical protein